MGNKRSMQCVKSVFGLSFASLPFETLVRAAGGAQGTEKVCHDYEKISGSTINSEGQGDLEPMSRRAAPVGQRRRWGPAVLCVSFSTSSFPTAIHFKGSSHNSGS
jgi:hypothetical protein